MDRQGISSNSQQVVALEPRAASPTSDQLVRWGWTTLLYGSLLWLCWPTLSFPALSLSDRDLLEALAPLPLSQALGWVGHTPLRPGQNLFFWLLAHGDAGLPLRAALIASLLLTTAIVHYSAAERGGHFVENIGAAACVSVNSTAVSVVCWLGAAHVGLSGLGILVYFEAARRALDRATHRTAWAVAALGALMFALAFYELAVLAPLAVVFWQRLFSPRRRDGELRQRLAATHEGEPRPRIAPAPDHELRQRIAGLEDEPRRRVGSAPDHELRQRIAGLEDEARRRVGSAVEDGPRRRVGSAVEDDLHRRVASMLDDGSRQRVGSALDEESGRRVASGLEGESGERVASGLEDQPRRGFAAALDAARRRVAAALDPTGILYLGSALCVALYLPLQAHALAGVQLWTSSAGLLFANMWRVGLINFWIWLNPFDAFGVLIPDGLTGHGVENALCWLLGAIEIAVLWRLCRIDRISAFGGIWFVLFLVPAGALMEYEGSLIALHRIYIPMLGLAWPAVRLVTRALEKLHDSLRLRWLRLAIMLPLSVVLLWSIVPMLAECYREVRLWGDEEQLYLASLRNYPENPEVLGRVTRNYLPYRDVSFDRSSAEPWPEWLDTLLMRPPRDSAEILIKEGHALVDSARYVEAGSAFARALGAGARGDMRLDAGSTLVLALSHTDQRVSAIPLEERLRREYPDRSAPGVGSR